MRRWRVDEVGDPAKVLRLEEVALPRPGPDEALLAVDAVGLNFPDLLQVQGGYQVKPPLPFTPGQEVAGRVVDLGPSSGVAGAPHVPLGTRVLWAGTGGLAEHVVAPVADLLPIPASMPSTKAAALLTNYGTALFALEDRAHLAAGEVLLVHAAAGGVGSAAMQLGKVSGALVIGTAGGAAKKELLPALGADVAVDTLHEDFVQVVLDCTDGQGADVVVDPVGGDTFDRSRACINWDGRLLVVGFTSGRIPSVLVNHVLLHNYAVIGVYWGGALGRDPGGRQRSFERLCDLWERREIDPHIGGEFALADAPEAFRRLGARASVGKLVILPER